MSHQENSPKRFVISVSGRALFNQEESHAIFENQGKAAYEQHQAKNQRVPFGAGPALALVKKFLALNERLGEGAPQIEVVLISRDSGKTATRLFNSMRHHDLPILRTVLTDGEPSSNYIKPLNVNLFLSSNPEQVRRAIELEGIGGATIMPRVQKELKPISAKERAKLSPQQLDDLDRQIRRQGQIRIAFDGDAVLFSDESEKQYAEGGLEHFTRYETENQKRPLPSGPMRPFLEILHQLQQAFPNDDDQPIRTALITARGATVVQRVLTTFSDWGIDVNEVMFLAGSEKGPFVDRFGADLFFDDSKRHVESALGYANAGHVPFGVRNAEGASESNFTGGGQEQAAQARTPASDTGKGAVVTPLPTPPRRSSRLR